MQICEDLDIDGRGYVNTKVLAQILKSVPGIRPEILGPTPSPRFYQGFNGYVSSEQVGKLDFGYATVSGSMFKAK